MDYKKAYKEALAKCKAYIDDTQKRWSEEFCKATEEVFFEIFPELRESEDERTRKQILNYFLAQKVNEPQPVLDSWIAWLEKQSPYFLTPEESLGISSSEYNKIVDDCIFGEIKGNEGKFSPKIDGFDAELNVLLKKYEHLPKVEILGCLNFYVLVLGKMEERQ